MLVGAVVGALVGWFISALIVWSIKSSLVIRTEFAHARLIASGPNCLTTNSAPNQPNTQIKQIKQSVGWWFDQLVCGSFGSFSNGSMPGLFCMKHWHFMGFSQNAVAPKCHPVNQVQTGRPNTQSKIDQRRHGM